MHRRREPDNVMRLITMASINYTMTTKVHYNILSFYLQPLKRFEDCQRWSAQTWKYFILFKPNNAVELN